MQTFPLCHENIYRTADKPSGQLTALTGYFLLFPINFGLNVSLWRSDNGSVCAKLLQEAPVLRRTLYFLMERTKQHNEDHIVLA